jgi:caffeoyl-CoA O-methyltransferase
VSNRTLSITDQLYQYLVEKTLREPEVLGRLRTETAQLPMAGMQISPEQGQFMTLLAELIGVTNSLEIGVFTGYSSLCIALAMPADGRIVACDVNEEWTRVARRYWKEAGVADKIELRLGPALLTLDELIQKGQSGKYDFAFIDADKSNYDGYYERCLVLLRRGGVIAVDNALWGGSVADPAQTDSDTAAIRALNAKVQGDARVSMSLLPIGDGLLLARKRG